MSKQIKRHKIRTGGNYVDMVTAFDHDAALSVNDARIASLEQAIYDLRYAHRYAPSCQAGAVEKCLCWNCSVDRAVLPDAQPSPAPVAASQGEEGREVPADLLRRIEEHLGYDSVGAPSESTARDLVDELRALLGK